jgi:spermidine/putrescine transport system permease protein
MKGLFGSLTALVFLFLYLPILVIVIFSFSQGRVLSLPIQGWTLDWYGQVLADQRLQAGLFNSLRVAGVATAIAAILGTLAAIAVQRYTVPGNNLFRSAVVIPILLPGIITGVVMLSFFARINLPLGLLTIIIGHATFGFPIVFKRCSAKRDSLRDGLYIGQRKTPYRSTRSSIVP